jgi:RNA polymerase sigma factor (sigma-70 family)
MDVESLIPKLRKLCKRRTSNPHVAEDALQGALLKVLENKHKFDPARGNPSNWAHTIAVRSCYDEYRQSNRLVYLGWSDDWESGDHPLEARLIAQQQVQSVFGLLPKRHVDILRVVCLEEATTKEAAEHFGITPALVSVRLCRARAQFRAVSKQLERI